MKTFKMTQDLYEDLSEEDMVKRYIPLVKSKSYKWHEYYCRIANDHIQKLDREDFEQVGCMAIMKCYREYDINLGNIFYTYLLNVIDNHMNRCVRDTLKLRNEGATLISKRIASIDETISYNDNGNKDITLGDIISCDEDKFEEIENKIFIDDLLSVLDGKEKSIIENYYINNMTQVQLSDKFNVTQVQISRTLKKAIVKIRKSISEKNTNKGELDMAKLNDEQLKQYLLEHASKDFSVTKIVKDYCKEYSVPESTAFTALSRRMSDFYEKLKGMCKDAKDIPIPRKVDFDVEKAKYFLKVKVQKEKYSLSKAMLEYSNEAGVSVSTIRSRLLNDDKDFMDKIKAKSLANTVNIINESHKLEEENKNIMPRDTFKDPFEEKKDIPVILEDYGMVPISNPSKEDNLVSLLKDLQEAKVSFDGKVFSYTIGSYGVKVCDSDGRMVCNNKMQLEDIENLIDELNKVAKITKTLF